MLSKRCTACGRDGHPRTQHPSSFKTELSLWLVALVVGTGAGLWSAATSSSSEPLTRTAQSMALSSIQPVAAEPAQVGTDAPASDAAGSPALAWLLQVVVAFLKAAWWVLPIPIAFSIWRQWGTYPVCGACGSRRLAEVPTPHGMAPPVGSR